MSKRTSFKRAPFFIVGCPRSGTTLLQRMLTAHPDVAVAPETFFMRRFWERREVYDPLADDDHLDRLVDDIVATPEVAEMDLGAGAFREAVAASRSWPAVFRELLRQWGREEGVDWVGEKTPNHVLYLSELQSWFPEATFLHLVRDPRAVVNSWRTVPWSSGYRWRDAEVWVEYVQAGRTAEALHGDAVTSLRFENLVRTPEEVLRSVCDALDLPYNDRMLAFHEQDPSMVDVEREPWKRRVTDPIDPDVADRWRDGLSAGDQAQVEAVAASEMRPWGYAPETASLRRLGATLRIWIERPVWKAGLLVEEAQGGDQGDNRRADDAGKWTLGFLHVGHAEHGVARYGRVLAEGAREHLDDAQVLEAAIDWTADPERHDEQLQQALDVLAPADVVHVQYNERVWGESLRALINVDRFVRRRTAQVVVTIHDVRNGYGLGAMVRRLYQRSTSLSALLSGEDDQNERAESGRSETATASSPGRSLARSVGKGLRYLVQEASNALATLRLARSASRVLVCTREEARRLRGVAGRDRLEVIPHFVEARSRTGGRTDAKQTLGLEGMRVLGMLGFVHRRKGYDLAVDALAHLSEDVALVCIGRPALDSHAYAESLRKRAAELGVDDRVQITGYVPEDELDRYLAATDLALCPFRRVSASGSLATWIAAERPILASRLPLFAEYNERVPGAIATFDPYAPEALARQAQEELARGEDEIQPRLQALRTALSVQAVMAQHEEVYRQALDGRST